MEYQEGPGRDQDDQDGGGRSPPPRRSKQSQPAKPVEPGRFLPSCLFRLLSHGSGDAVREIGARLEPEAGVSKSRSQIELRILKLAAAAALRQVLLQAKTLRDVQLVIEIGRQIHPQVFAIHPALLLFCCTPSRGFNRMRLNHSRPRDSRDMTVPTGTPAVAAISL